MPRLKDFYQTEVSKAMMEKFGYKAQWKYQNWSKLWSTWA